MSITNLKPLLVFLLFLFSAHLTMAQDAHSTWFKTGSFEHTELEYKH